MTFEVVQCGTYSARGRLQLFGSAAVGTQRTEHMDRGSLNVLQEATDYPGSR
jgi:hypothetical protein